MNSRKVQTLQNALAGLNFSGLDRLFQQYDNALGMILAFPRVGISVDGKFSPNAAELVSPEFLSSVIDVLTRRDIEIISIADLPHRIRKPLDNQRFAVLTFDNAYRDTAHHAVPVLEQKNVPFTLNVATGLIEGSADLWRLGLQKLLQQQRRLMIQTAQGPLELDCDSNGAKQKSFDFLKRYLSDDVPEIEMRERVREICWLYKIDLDALREEAIMNWDELIELSANPLCTLGTMTIDHHRLSRLTAEKARYEVVQGATVLQGVTGEKPAHFCYPYGDRDAASKREFEIVRKARFKTGLTRRTGLIYPEHKNHMMALPRVTVSGLFQRKRFFGPLTSGLPSVLANGFKRLDAG